MASISSETVQQLKQQLQQAHSDGTAVPQDLYSHLSEVFARVVKNHPKDAYEKFEEISTLVKRTHLKFNDPKDANALNSQKSSDHSDAVKAWIRKSKDLLNEVSFLFFSNAISKGRC